MQLSMTAPPGMKPMFDGTFKKAGEHPTTFTLEHENGARAIVDTHTATCISWKTPAGKELIQQGKGTSHMFMGAPLKGEFVPEERAKKVSGGWGWGYSARGLRRDGAARHTQHYMIKFLAFQFLWSLP